MTKNIQQREAQWTIPTQIHRRMPPTEARYSRVQAPATEQLTETREVFVGFLVPQPFLPNGIGGSIKSVHRGEPASIISRAN